MESGSTDQSAKQATTFKIRLWAIIGPPGAGKSSTIGALAGFEGPGAGGKRDILLRGGGWLRMHAFRQSQQEAKLTPETSLAKTLDKARRKQGWGATEWYNVLIALRSDNVNGLPKADDYLRHYIQNGWIIESLALLDIPNDYDTYARFGSPTCLVENSSENARSAESRPWIFGSVRNHFGWA